MTSWWGRSPRPCPACAPTAARLAARGDLGQGAWDRLGADPDGEAPVAGGGLELEAGDGHRLAHVQQEGDPGLLPPEMRVLVPLRPPRGRHAGVNRACGLG